MTAPVFLSTRATSDESQWVLVAVRHDAWSCEHTQRTLTRHVSACGSRSDEWRFSHRTERLSWWLIAVAWKYANSIRILNLQVYNGSILPPIEINRNFRKHLSKSQTAILQTECGFFEQWTLSAWILPMSAVWTHNYLTCGLLLVVGWRHRTVITGERRTRKPINSSVINQQLYRPNVAADQHAHDTVDAASIMWRHAATSRVMFAGQVLQVVNPFRARHSPFKDVCDVIF